MLAHTAHIRLKHAGVNSIFISLSYQYYLEGAQSVCKTLNICICHVNVMMLKVISRSWLLCHSWGWIQLLYLLLQVWTMPVHWFIVIALEKFTSSCLHVQWPVSVILNWSRRWVVMKICWLSEGSFHVEECLLSSCRITLRSSSLPPLPRSSGCQG